MPMDARLGHHLAWQGAERPAGGGERIRPAAPAASEAARRTSTNVRYVPAMPEAVTAGSDTPSLATASEAAWPSASYVQAAEPAGADGTAFHSAARPPISPEAAGSPGGGAHPDAGGAAADRSDWAAPPPHAELRLRHGAPRAHCDALRQAARPGRPAPRRRPDTCTAFNAGRIAGCKCRGSTSGWPQPAPRPLPQARSEGSPCGARRSARPRT